MRTATPVEQPDNRRLLLMFSVARRPQVGRHNIVQQFLHELVLVHWQFKRAAFLLPIYDIVRIMQMAAAAVD